MPRFRDVLISCAVYSLPRPTCLWLFEHAPMPDWLAVHVLGRVLRVDGKRIDWAPPAE